MGMFQAAVAFLAWTRVPCMVHNVISDLCCGWCASLICVGWCASLICAVKSKVDISKKLAPAALTKAMA